MGNYERSAVLQQGAFGTRWTTIPDEQCIWSELENETEAVSAAFHHAVNTHDKPALLQRIRMCVLKVQQLPGVRLAENRWAVREGCAHDLVHAAVAASAAAARAEVQEM